MKKYLLAFSTFFISITLWSQIETNENNKANKNYLDVALGLGNETFSAHNQASNAIGVTNKLILTPTITYHTKNGFSFGIGSFLTSDSLQKMSVYQTALNVGYDYDGEEVAAGFSYSRFLSDKNKYNNNSLYQNEIYAYIKKAKGILLPGISFGFANGNYKEIDLVLFTPAVGLPRWVNDSTSNKSKYFSISPNISHNFNFENLFTEDDNLSFTPSLILNYGSDDLVQTHTDKLYNRKILSKRKHETLSNKLQMQSLALSLENNYNVGHFYFQPNICFDYFLPSTTNKRLNTLYTFTVGVSF